MPATVGKRDDADVFAGVQVVAMVGEDDGDDGDVIVLATSCFLLDEPDGDPAR